MKRNFLGIKFHHLRALIYRPCLCLEVLHSKELDQVASNWGGMWDHAASRLAEATCIAEARQTIHMLDGVMDKRELLWSFPWWQMISCLMCAMSVLMITRIVYPQHSESGGLEADIEACYKVLEALSTKSAAAERCLKIIDVMRHAQIQRQGTFFILSDFAGEKLIPAESGSSTDVAGLKPTPGALLQPFADSLGFFQDPQADVVGMDVCVPLLTKIRVDVFRLVSSRPWRVSIL